jgi:regulatory protein
MAGGADGARTSGVSGETAADGRALELAYRYLSRRERTVHELREHLAARDIDPGGIAAAVDELTATGSLNDERYAAMFVEDRRELDQWGSGRIRRTLRDRGVAAELIDAALEEGSQAELGRALAVLGQRFPAPPTGHRERQRALGLLLRRGFEPELAIDALAAYR